MGNGAISLPRAQEVRLVETVATLAGSGLTAQDAYAAAADVLSGSTAGRVAEAVTRQIESGASPAAASRAVTSRLSPMHESMLTAAEETGAYATTLGRASAHLRSSAELREKVIGAAIYPAFVLFLTVMGAVLLVTLVFPVAAEFMAATGALQSSEIEAILATGTRTLLGLVGLIVLVIAAIVAAALSDELRLRLPVIGQLERYGELLAFAQSLAALQAVGFPLDRSFATAAQSLRNRYLRERLLYAGSEISAGVTASITVAHALPRAAIVARWFSLADHGADPLVATEGLIRFLQAELARRSERLGSILEPVFVILAGVMIVLVVVTLVQPLFGLYGEVLP
jgi:general secretion pathway protein F